MSLLAQRVIAGALLILAAAAAPSPLRAQPAGTAKPVLAPVILIVDLQQMLQDSKAAKAVQSVLNQQYGTYSKGVAQREDELRKQREELERQRTVLAPETFNMRATELQQRYDALGKEVQGRRQALQQSLNESMNKVKTAALEVVADIVKERKANLVIEKQAMVFEAEDLDITAEAIKRLDQKLPSVPVNLPKFAGEGAAAKGTAETPGKKR